jgi:chromate transporter
VTDSLEAARALASHLAMVSFFTIGGAHVVLPDIYRLIVTERQWLEPAQFSQIVALSQAAPGPNVLMIAMFGYLVGGLPFALLATVSLILPTSILCYLAMMFGSRPEGGRWKSIIKTALGPMTAGLVMASGLVLARGADAGAAGWVLTALGAAASGFTKINPLLVIVLAGAVGLVLPV